MVDTISYGWMCGFLLQQKQCTYVIIDVAHQVKCHVSIILSSPLLLLPSTAGVPGGRGFLEDAGFDWKVLGPDVRDVDYVAWQCDQDAYACSGQKCSAQSMLFMHDAWLAAGLPQKMEALCLRKWRHWQQGVCAHVCARAPNVCACMHACVRAAAPFVHYCECVCDHAPQYLVQPTHPPLACPSSHLPYLL